MKDFFSVGTNFITGQKTKVVVGRNIWGSGGADPPAGDFSGFSLSLGIVGGASG
jgi:hypothetical protein